ncbi:erythrocyte binding antigen-181, partial [Plasmodium reichenowi]
QLEGKSLEMENGTYHGSNDEEDVTGPSVEDITNDDNNSFHNIANQSDVLNREDAIASETQVESEPEDSNRVITTEVPSTTVTTTDEKLSEQVEEKEAEEIKEPVESRVIRETMENSANLDSPAHEEDVEKETLEPEKNELYNDTSRGNISEKDLNDIQSLRTETDSTVLDDSSENGERTEDSESEVGILRKHNFSTEQNEEKDFDPVESDLEKEEIKNLLNLEKEEDADVEIIDRTHDSMSDGDNGDSNNNNLSSEEKIEQYKNRDVSKEREEILNMSKTNICSNEHSLKYCQFMERNKDLLETCSLENRLHLCCAISDYCLKYFNPNSLEYFNCTQNEFDDPTYNCFRKQRFT